MMKPITFDDILASNEVRPNAVFSWHPKEYNDLKKNNKKAKFDVTWVKLKFVFANGKKVPCRLKFTNQIIASGAKGAQTEVNEDDEGGSGAITIQFRPLKREYIEGDPYEPRQMETEEKQQKENERIQRNINEYKTNNEKMIKVLDIIDASYNKVAREIIQAGADKKLEYTVRKDRKKEHPTIFSIKQASRYDDEKKEDILLEEPIYRIKLPVYKKDGRIGSWNNFKDRFRPVIFDARKMTKKNGNQPVPAYVKKGKKRQELNTKNVSSFVTVRSLTSGIINFDCVTVSKFGLSLGNSFNELFIIPNRSTKQEATVSHEEVHNMRSGMASDEEGTDEEIAEDDDIPVSNDPDQELPVADFKQKKKSPKERKTDSDRQNDGEPLGDDGDGDHTSDGDPLDDDPPSDDGSDKPTDKEIIE